MSEPAGNGTQRKGLLLIAVIFLLGLVCGSALTVIGVRSVMPERPPRGGMHPGAMRGGMERFEELGLDADQRARIREILRRSRGEVHQILQASREEIRAVLTDEQQEAFDRMRHPRRRRPRSDGPPPP